MRSDKTGLKCPGCEKEIVKAEIDDLLIDNTGAWHRICYPQHPAENSGARGVSLAA